jgi:8-oxo-dGTP pyrophosphatase MutT (NUDIX family)
VTDEPLRATVSLRGVLFTPDGDVLLVRRTSDGGWELPGGRLGAKEDAQEGVQREIREETGLDPRVRRPVHAVSWRNDADNGRFGVYYHCRVQARAVTLSQEHTDYDWVSPTEAADRLSEVQGEAVARATEVDER